MTVQIAFAIMRRFVLKGTLHISIRDGVSTGAKCQLVGRYDGAQVGITLADEATMWRIVRQPDIAIGEAYMDGSLTIDDEDLDSLMHLLLDNYAHWDDQWVGRVSRALYRLRARFHLLNPPSKAQRNVAHHYDLSDALFASFLDPWRQYSCAYYDGPDTTLATAQQTKIARLAAKLDLRCGDHILDIGSGWGGLAIGFDACVPDLDVTGITLSREQHAFATTAAQERGISDRVRFALRDYRHQQGHFDKIVSVGMLEHVGPANYHTYFRSIQQLLRPNGVALVHSIAVYCNPQPVNRWISKYIFPGGFLPSIEQLVTAAAGAGLKVLDMEVMRARYAIGVLILCKTKTR